MDTRIYTDRDGNIETRPGLGATHTETAREARQGPLGRPILYVLVGGLILAVVYVVGTQIWSGSEDLPPANQIQEETTTPPAVNFTPAPLDVTPTPAPALTPAPVAPAP